MAGFYHATMKIGTGPLAFPSLALRLLALLALLAANGIGIAQELPDPGRRLSREEQEADPEKPRPPVPRPADARRSGAPRDAQACKNARVYYQLACGAPDSRRSFGRDCAEAYALYRDSC
jgi:hypothetical protein